MGIPEQADHLRSLQNPDGGWPYARGKGSWVEPTVFALLALRHVAGVKASEAQGLDFLARCRKQDGGWSPALGVDASSWVTALAVLLLSGTGNVSAGDPAVRWLLAGRGRESTLLYRIRLWMLGAKEEYENASPGWPWTPDTAGWVVPTSFSVLALRQVQAQFPEPAISARIQQGCGYLLARRCNDLGWNHGDSRLRGFHSTSFPETTGLALLALGGANVPEIGGSIQRATAHARACRSTQGLCWLHLGLMAQGVDPGELPAFPLGWRRTIDAAMVLLCREAIAGKNVFAP